MVDTLHMGFQVSGWKSDMLRQRWRAGNKRAVWQRQAPATRRVDHTAAQRDRCGSAHTMPATRCTQAPRAVAAAAQSAAPPKGTHLRHSLVLTAKRPLGVSMRMLGGL